jgi:nitrogen fixation-related uncharacterized protein
MYWFVRADAELTSKTLFMDIYWTAWWIYLSIKAWKYWKWKALLPYPLCIVSIVMFSGSVTNSRIIGVISAVLNIGGLLIFYWSLHKSQLEDEDVKGRYLQEKSSVLIVGIIVVIGIVITLVPSWDRNVISRDGRSITYDNKPAEPPKVITPAPAIVPAPTATRDEFFQNLDRMIPWWRLINKEPEFIAWLNEYDYGSSQSRYELILAAYDKADAAEVAHYFERFLAEHTQR